MDFSEIDIWWLLNKRARIKISNSNLIKNTITYYIHPEYDSDKNDIIEALKTFNVVTKNMPLNKSLLEFMKNNFKAINS